MGARKRLGAEQRWTLGWLGERGGSVVAPRRDSVLVALVRRRLVTDDGPATPADQDVRDYGKAPRWRPRPGTWHRFTLVPEAPERNPGARKLSVYTLRKLALAKGVNLTGAVVWVRFGGYGKQVAYIERDAGGRYMYGRKWRDKSGAWTGTVRIDRTDIVDAQGARRAWSHARLECPPPEARR